MSARAPTPPVADSVDLADIQGIVRFGYKRHTEAAFVLLRVRDRTAARAWLAAAPVSSAATLEPPPDTAMQVALSSPGLAALGVAGNIVQAFSSEFVSGLGNDTSRARRLGDVGANAPLHWQWGNGERTPHVLLMLYAVPGRLEALQRELLAACAEGFEPMAILPSTDMHGIEPFGFVDGISQPQLDWQRQRPARDAEQPGYSNLGCLGEYLLGYPNEYGGYTDRPLLDPRSDAQAALLPRAEDVPDQADLGRNGSYLVMRQLRQDVHGFWHYLDRQAGGDPALREQLASALVGRTRKGEPLVHRGAAAPLVQNGSAAAAAGGAVVDLNDFDYAGDPRGLRCPLGAHVRRANPRNADLPPGEPGLWSWLKRTLGFDADALAHDRIASTRFHRLLRRGREYGAPVLLSQALEAAPAAAEVGLHFICLGANIARQFEFVQSAWMAGLHFDRLSGESDPLLGAREPTPEGRPTSEFSMPQTEGPDRCLAGLPQFVTVTGGAYFFLPGIRALRYLATAPPKE